MNSTAGSYLLPDDRRLLAEVALNITATYVDDTASAPPPGFFSMVVATVEEALVAACHDIELPSVMEVEV